MLLGVNIDHVATLRQARKEDEPNLVQAAKEALSGGADGITIHLREDRRHIQDDDVIQIRKLDTRLNLEMAATDEMVKIACAIKPDFCCLVPEKREELTTEGGLNVIANEAKLKKATQQLQIAGIQVSLFIDPDKEQITKAKSVGANYIEIHTGVYANATEKEQEKELNTIKEAVTFATSIGLKVNAGHGLKYHNTKPICEIKGILELNIGHSIISKAIFTGLKNAIQEMKTLIEQ
jgi:pyridoxine 5-phosphate synthase